MKIGFSNFTPLVYDVDTPGIGGNIHLIKDIQLVHYGKFGYTFENR